MARSRGVEWTSGDGFGGCVAGKGTDTEGVGVVGGGGVVRVSIAAAISAVVFVARVVTASRRVWARWRVDDRSGFRRSGAEGTVARGDDGGEVRGGNSPTTTVG